MSVDVFIDHKSLRYVFLQRKIHILHKRWLVLLKDYDINVLYHSGKANVLTDTLSRLSIGSVTHVKKKE